jgi:hypothetical protein
MRGATHFHILIALCMYQCREQNVLAHKLANVGLGVGPLLIVSFQLNPFECYIID